MNYGERMQAINPEGRENLEVIARAIKSFLMHRYDGSVQSTLMPWEITIESSRPMKEVEEQMKSGNFEIQDLSIQPGLKRGQSFEFTIGEAKFILKGQAVRQVTDRIQGKAA